MRATKPKELKHSHSATTYLLSMNRIFSFLFFFFSLDFLIALFNLFKIKLKIIIHIYWRCCATVFLLSLLLCGHKVTNTNNSQILNRYKIMGSGGDSSFWLFGVLAPFYKYLTESIAVFTKMSFIDIVFNFVIEEFE